MPRLRIELGGEVVETGRADPVAELRLRALHDVDFHLLPVVAIIPHLLTVGADGKHAGKGLHLGEQGEDALVQSALKGKNAMPPKGGNASLSDADVMAAVDYLASQGK